MAEQAQPVKNMDLAFDQGDHVVHPYQGAGELKSIEQLEVAGVERYYYCIELVTGDGTLMLPVGQADEIGLRGAFDEPEMVETILFDEPEKLASNYRSREAHVSKMINSGELPQIIQAIRDLAWHGHRKRLTNTDAKLKAEAQKLVASEWALAEGVTFETAQRKLNALVRKAMDEHGEELEQ